MKTAKDCGCLAPIVCVDTPGCGTRASHSHGENCTMKCRYCFGHGVPVFDPEKHPNHREVLRGW